MGINFTRVLKQVYELDIGLSPPLAYPVAAGLATRYLGCELRLSLSFFLQSFVGNLISVAVRAGLQLDSLMGDYSCPVNASCAGTC